MSSKIESRSRTFQVSAALKDRRIVKMTTGKLAYAGATDAGAIGVTTKETFAADDYTAIDLLNSEGTVIGTASGAITKGNDIYQDASGKVSATGTIKAGVAMQTVTADNDYIEYLPIASAAPAVTVSVTLAAGATNSFDATITVKDSAGNTIAAPYALEVYISHSATGQGLTTTAASGALTASTGAILTALTAKKHVSLVTAATGIAVLNLVDSAKTAGEYVVVKNPTTGAIVISAATVTGTYG